MVELPQTIVPTLEKRLDKRRGGDVLVKRLQGWYNEVPRWGGKEAPKDNYRETLLGHVRSMNNMVDTVAQTPALSQRLNLPRLNLILGIHDLGEVGTGDIYRGQKDYEESKEKQDMTEKQYFLKVILPALPYVKIWEGKFLEKISGNPAIDWLPFILAQAHRGYLAYERLTRLRNIARTRDKEALLAKMMDRMDAVTKGVEHYHVGKEGAEKEDAVIRQLAGANRASSLHLYRLFELLGKKGQLNAMQDLGTFMLDFAAIWDTYDRRVFDTPRKDPNTGKMLSYSELLPSFADVLKEIEGTYHITFTNSKGEKREKREEMPTDQTIGSFLHDKKSVPPQRL